MPIGYIILILFGLCLFVTTIGFKKYVYFLSIGYGFSVSVCGIAIAIIFALQKSLTITSLIACVLFVIYGLRLSLFLLIRELKNVSYRNTLEKVSKTEKPMPVFVLITMWISVAVLYVCQTSGIAFSLNNINGSFFDYKLIEIIALVIMIIAILIESIADKQKSRYKKIDPKKPAMGGLYKICRCPNYTGEILFWTGVLVFSCTSLNVWYEWLIVIFGYLCIVYVMLNGAKRLETRQNKNYESLEDFKTYINKTPLIFLLFIPIHTLKNSKIVR